MQHCGVHKVCFLNVNNLKTNIINTKYTIFKHTLWRILEKIRSVWLSFQVSLQPEEFNSCLHFSSFHKRFLFVSLLLLLVLISILFFLSKISLIFGSFGCLFLALLQFSFARRSIKDFRFFSSTILRIKTNFNLNHFCTNT